MMAFMRRSSIQMPNLVLCTRKSLNLSHRLTAPRIAPFSSQVNFGRDLSYFLIETVHSWIVMLLAISGNTCRDVTSAGSRFANFAYKWHSVLEYRIMKAHYILGSLSSNRHKRSTSLKNFRECVRSREAPHRACCLVK